MLFMAKFYVLVVFQRFSADERRIFKKVHIVMNSSIKARKAFKNSKFHEKKGKK